MRLVLDTDVVVAALRSPNGASAELLRRIESGTGTLLLNVAMACEYEMICGLAEHRIVNGTSLADVENFVANLVELAVPVHSHFRWRPSLPDPHDEMVLDAAVNGGAAAIVTFNRKDYRTVQSQFGIEVLLPREALERIRKL